MSGRIVKIPLLTNWGLEFKLFLILSFLLLTFFAFLMYINTKAYSDQLESNVIQNAMQVSDLVKRSMSYSMLKNHKEDLARTVDNLGLEKGVEGIWIFDKKGIVKIASNHNHLLMTVGKEAEQCIFCHRSDEAKGTLPVENRHRVLNSAAGYRIIGLINPIENETSCHTESCHAHSPDEKLLGLLDIHMSLKDVDNGVSATRKRIIAISCVLAIFIAFLLWALIRVLVHRPISKLIEGTKQVAGMNLDYRIDLNAKDELGVLAASFNSMTAEVKKAQNNTILMAKMASLGKLSAMVAHELNNPLAGILNYTKLCIRNLNCGTGSGDVKDTLENLGIIRDEVKRCGDIVNNLLIYARKTVGKTAVEDISLIVKRCVELVRHGFHVKNVALEADLDESGLNVRCDRDAIQQMILALLINALEAVSQNIGRVKVRTARLRNENKVRISVCDNGPGIPKDMLARLFEPFSSGKSSEKNLGLGLSVVFSVVQGHGGTISVNSTEGEGAEFIIDIPDKSPCESAPNP